MGGGKGKKIVVLDPGPGNSNEMTTEQVRGTGLEGEEMDVWRGDPVSTRTQLPWGQPNDLKTHHFPASANTCEDLW